MTPDEIYHALRLYLHRNNDSQSDVSLFGASKSSLQVIKLFNQDKVTFENINFSLIGPILHDLNFSNCTIHNCDFTKLSIVDCQFQGCQFTGTNTFTDVHVDDSTTGLSEQDIKKIPYKWDFSDWYEWVFKQDGFQWFDFDSVSYFTRRHIGYLTSDQHFITFFKPGTNQSREIDDHLGWKLHVSVDIQSFVKAFNLIAPILFKNCPAFKVINLYETDKSLGDRMYFGAQFTIYLENENKLALTSEEAMKLVRDVSLVLERNQIKPGVIPESDAKTRSIYCSIRNDCMVLNKNLMKDRRRKEGGLPLLIKEYVLAKVVGSNFNPANELNPYSLLLSHQPVDFSFASYVDSFFSKDRESYEQALMLYFYAYLREYTMIDTFNAEEMDDFKYQCCCNFYAGGCIDSHFIKESFRENGDIKAYVPIYGVIMDWLWSDRTRVPSDRLFPAFLTVSNPIFKDIERKHQSLKETRDYNFLMPLEDYTSFIDLTSPNNKITYEEINDPVKLVSYLGDFILNNNSSDVRFTAFKRLLELDVEPPDVVVKQLQMLSDNHFVPAKLFLSCEMLEILLKDCAKDELTSVDIKSIRIFSQAYNPSMAMLSACTDSIKSIASWDLVKKLAEESVASDQATFFLKSVAINLLEVEKTFGQHKSAIMSFKK